MRKKTLLTTTLCFIFLVLFPLSSAMAHKVRVFAYESGGEIFTEAKFNNGRPAKNSAIVVMNNADGAVLIEGLTDDKGLFHFTIPKQAKANKITMNVIVDVGEGHRGSWLLSPSDYLFEKNITPSPPPAQHSIQPQSLQPQSSQPQSSQPAKGLARDTDYSRLEQIFEKTLEQELAPIIRMLAENKEDKLTLRDILGGLGFIFGIAGMAAYFQSKKTRREK